MNILIILKSDFLYIKDLFYLKGCGTECAPYLNLITNHKQKIVCDQKSPIALINL